MWAKEIIELWIGHLLGSNEEPMQPELTHSSGEVFRNSVYLYPAYLYLM